MNEKRQDFIVRAKEIVKEYIAGEEEYGDNACICVDPSTLEMELQPDYDEEQDPQTDAYSVPDFIASDPGKPGRWVVDDDAIEALADEYFH